MFKKILNFLLLSSIGSAIFMLFFACSVGLGESVDTEVPKIEITYPPASSPVRDWFYLAGTASDDKGVASVSVSAENISTNEITDLGTFTPEKDGTWAVKINEKDSAENYKLKDGTYTFCVITKDTSGQKSAPAYRTIEVDNTPPVFVIKNPGTIKAGKPSAFGSILKIVGAAADDHDIYELSLAVYDNPAMEGEPKAVISEKNVDKTDGINVTLARYNLAVDSGAAVDELHNNYLKIYDVAGGGNQNFFASVTLKDSAGVWQDYTKNQPSSVGNSTNGGLYLNDSVYETLMGKKSKYGLSAADFMRLLNGTYKNTAVSASSEERTAATTQASLDDEAKKEILKILGERKTETSKTPLAFSLNKNANPTYTVMGFSFDSSAESIANLGGHKAAKQNSLTFKAQAGLDGAYVKPTTLKIYLFGPYENGFCTAEKLEEIYSDPDLFYERSIKTAKESAKAANGGTEPSEELVAGFAKAQILKDYSSSGASTAETFSESIELPSFITKGKYYLLAATGEDEDGVKLMTSYYYGFVGESAGTPPAVSITGFADGVMKNSVLKIKVSGTLKSEETELAGVAYSVVVFDEIDSKTVGTITGEVSSDNFSLDSKRLSASWEVQDILKGTLSYENDYAAFEPKDGKRFKYTVTVTGKDTTGLVSKDTRSFTVDRKVPEIKINDITPVAKKETAADGTVSKYIVNGKIKFSTVVTDTNLKNVKVTVTDGTKSETLFEGNSSTIEKEIDTTKYKDENFLTFKVEAEDSAENTAVSSKTDVWVSQQTDMPEIKFTNGKSAEELGGSGWANVTNGQNVFGIENNNSANFTITDDDGLSLVRVTVFDENKKQIGSEGAVSVADAQLQAQPDSENAKESAANPVEYKVSGGSTSYALAYKLPQKAGKYKILIEVFDTGHDTADEANKVWHTTKCENYVLISEGRISISFAEISNNTCQVKANEKTTIKGTVSLSALEKLASIERFASKETTVTEENGESGTKWIKVPDCSSKYPYEADAVETEKITAKAEGGKIVWEDNIPASMIVDGTQHFFYKATDIAGNSAEIELICNGDGTDPDIKIDSEVYEKYDAKWVNSTSVKLSVIAADVNGYEPSGIAKVSYSYKKGDSDITGELSRDGKPCNADGKIVEDGKYYKYTATSDLSETPSSGTMITFTAKDKVGNKSDMPPLAYKVDTTAPSAGTPSIVPSQVLNNSGSVVVTYSASDALSGVKSVEFSTDSNMKDAKSVAEKAGTYAYPLAGLQDGERTVYVRVTDNAGNRSESVSSGSFIVDNTPPKVTVTSPASGNVVNKTISLSGTVVDNNLTKNTTPVLHYFDGAEWKTLAFTSSTLDGQNWTISGIDTTKLNNSTDSKEFEFKVQFTDDAGNVNESLSSEYKLKVDQNTDRPEIKLTNVKISGSITSSSEIMGVITDDDGNYNNLKLYRINKADYDSNTSANKTPLTSGNSWKEITVENGTGIWKTKLDENESQGLKSWYFYVTDSVNGSFCTAESSPLNRPYLSDSSTESGVDNTTGISFTFDNKAPEVSLKISHDGTNWEDTNSIFGINSSVYIKAIVKEEVGMKSATLSVVGKEIQSITENPVPAGNVYEYLFSEIKLTTYRDIASLAISVTAEDSAGQTNKDMRNITVDSKAPSVKIVSPTTSSSDIVSSAISIKGTVLDDYSSIETLKYAIPFKDTLKEPDWKNVGTSAGWEIRFASGAQESSESLIYYAVAKDANGYLYDIKQTGIADVYEVPIWFYVKDSAGNEAYIKDQYVLVDSESGKPKAWINSPADGTTTSGVVTVYGGASDNVSVERVQIQIDVDGDGDFDGKDYELIKDSGYLGEQVALDIKGDSSDWYIPVSGTNSWKYTIDTTSNTYSSIKIRVRAYDGDNQTRDWTNPITVKLDSETPTIKNMRLVQYGKGVTPTDTSDPVTEKEYIAGMYISNKSVEANGEWYFVADVADNGNVSSIEFSKINSSDSTVNIDLGLSDIQNLTTKEYKLRIPLKTSETGRINYKITARDANTGFATANMLINIDSTAPSLYNTSNTETTSPADQLRLKSLGLMLGKEKSNSTVVNSNSYFTLGDVVSESSSGLDYIAFYFERNGKTENRVYNPMFKIGNKSVISSSKTDGAVYINEDGLAALYLKEATRNSEDSFELTSENENAHVGGLVKIAGNYCRITGVSGTTVKFTPTVSTKFKEVELILAQVVDHQITESLGSDGKIVNDDGDGMVESIQQVGSSYNWQASINSLNIPDGPINICVTAIDKAGNITHGKIATRVENKRPRIAKVLLGTDLNGNGKYDWNANSAPVTVEGGNDNTNDGKSYGEFSYYSALTKNGAKAQSVVDLASKEFKVISGLMILPEFVGGNTSLGYILENTTDLASLTSATYKTGTVVSMTTKSDIISKVNNLGSVDISTQISDDFGGIELSSPASGFISLTFWDQTEETTQGTDSQWALLKIPVNLMAEEEVTPIPIINPFYWNSKTDNSVYDIDGVLQGHIELEGDLPEDVKTSLGSEPKVSGKIKIQGTVTDNVRISSINMSAAGIFTNVTLANYKDGLWKYTSKPDGVVSFEVVDESISQEGHKVKYTLVLDTEKLSSVAADNVNITISAKDWQKNESSDVTYTVDVVPYVTQIWTQLSESERTYASMYARTSTGEYVVRSGEEITIYGWNLNNSPSVSLSGNTISGTVIEKSNVDVKQGSYGFKFNVPDVTSGELNVTVNSIPALNNINEKDARGSAEEDLKTSKTYDNYYNRQPNGQNNNELDDDIKLDVWNFKTAIKPNGSNANYVTMKVGPYLSDSERSGRIGFSFKNGSGYFNMPGYKYGSSSGDRLKLKFLKTDFTSSDKIYMWTPNPKIEPCGAWEGKPVTDLPSEGEYYVLEVTGYSSISYKFSSGKYKSDSNMTEISSEGVWEFDSSTSTKKFIRKASLQTSSSDSPTLYSQTKMGENYQGFTYNTFAFDNNAETYGMALCSDTSGKDYISANLQFFSRAHGHSGNSLNRNYYNAVNARRIENTTFYATDDPNYGTDKPIYNDERTKSLAMSTYVKDKNTYVYSAYYDQGLKRIVFRMGAVLGKGYENANNIDYGLQDLMGYTGYAEGGDGDTSKVGYYGNTVGDRVENRHRNSTQSTYVGNTENPAYKYVKSLDDKIKGSQASVAVGSLSDGSAVIAWFDDGTNTLKMTKVTFAQMTGGNLYNTTLTPKEISTKGGEGVSLVVDSLNGIHLAYESNEGSDLYYSYVSSDFAIINEVLVDSKNDVGSYCSIDVGRGDSTTKKWIPYITYKSNVATRTKIAYPVLFDSNDRPMAGATSGGFFTGNWAISMIPSENKSIDDKINVGLNKDWSDGVIHEFNNSSDIRDYSVTGSYSICESTINYGNGTKNPVLGYATSTGAIEMAQKK